MNIRINFLKKLAQSAAMQNTQEDVNQDGYNYNENVDEKTKIKEELINSLNKPNAKEIIKSIFSIILQKYNTNEDIIRLAISIVTTKLQNIDFAEELFTLHLDKLSDADAATLLKFILFNEKNKEKLTKFILNNTENGIINVLYELDQYSISPKLDLDQMVELSKQNRDYFIFFKRNILSWAVDTGSAASKMKVVDLLKSFNYTNYDGVLRWIIDFKGGAADEFKFLLLFVGQLSDKISNELLENTFKYFYDSNNAFLEYFKLLKEAKSINRGELLFKLFNSNLISVDRQNDILFYSELGKNLVLDLDSNEINDLQKKLLGSEYSGSRDIDELMKLSLLNNNCNKQNVYNYIIKSKNYIFALNLISNMPDNVDIPLLQKFIEASKLEQNILATLASMSAEPKYSKINFLSAKRRFNQIEGEKIKLYIQDDPDAKEKYVERLLSDASIYYSYYSDDEDNTYEDAKNYINICLSKNDFYSCQPKILTAIINNYFVTPWILNKSFESIYHEIKNSYKLIKELGTLKADIVSYKNEVERICKFGILNDIIKLSTNFAQYVKFCNRIMKAASISHNSNSLTWDQWRKVILNPSINLEDKTILELFEVIGAIDDYDLLMNKAKTISNDNPELLNINDFISNIELVNKLKESIDNGGSSFNFKRGSQEYNIIKKLHIQINLINQYSTIKKYIKQAKPKDQRLFNLNYETIDGLKFSVLKYLDPYAFQVGADTDCCQRVGGAGEEAAIDSFINPFAGVLILSYNNTIIAQSYFHYIPDDNGIILDNIEWNEKNAYHLGIDKNKLSKIYAEYANAIETQHPEISYILCGKSYNKINNNLFDTNSMEEDPREFSVDDPYSDFDEDDHIDLLQPKDELKGVTVTLHAPDKKEAGVNIQRIISKSAARMLALKYIN